MEHFAYSQLAGFHFTDQFIARLFAKGVRHIQPVSVRVKHKAERSQSLGSDSHKQSLFIFASFFHVFSRSILARPRQVVLHLTQSQSSKETKEFNQAEIGCGCF